MTEREAWEEYQRYLETITANRMNDPAVPVWDAIAEEIDED